jgi:hypothetical protein
MGSLVFILFATLMVSIVLYMSFLYQFVLSLFQRALATVVLMLLITGAICLTLVAPDFDIWVILGVCMVPTSILFALINWSYERNMVRKIIKSEDLLSKARGSRVFKLHRTQSYVGRIREIENA